MIIGDVSGLTEVISGFVVSMVDNIVDEAKVDFVDVIVDVD